MDITILLATTNKGKKEELRQGLLHLPFLSVLTLEDLGMSFPPPDEPAETIEENAIIKARYYAQKTNMVTLADDAGLFLDAVPGWPGVKSARVADTSDEKCKTVLNKLSEKPDMKRTASFQVALALCDPQQDSLFVSMGKIHGRILSEIPAAPAKMEYGFNRIFYVTENDAYGRPVNKTYGDMTVQEKNDISHRGKAMSTMRYFIQQTYGGQHIVVPLALIIREGKILMSQRNDPHVPEVHGRWEFPGGSVEMGEDIEETLKREVYEEAGYAIEIVDQIRYVGIDEVQRFEKHVHFQVYLLMYITRIIGGDGKGSDEEVLDKRWFGLDEVLSYPLVGNNAVLYKHILPELKKSLATHKL